MISASTGDHAMNTQHRKEKLALDHHSQSAFSPYILVITFVMSEQASLDLSISSA